MIPAIARSRSKLTCHINQYEDGNVTLFVLADTYPELFDALCGDITTKSPAGWKVSKGGKMRYLWFPEGTLDERDLDRITDWKEHFEQYVLIGLNKNIEEYFTDELDFCMALDYNKPDPEAEKRTHYGEAEYQFKYHGSLAHFGTLRAALVEAIEYLPIHSTERPTAVLTSIPSDPKSDSTSRRLAEAVAKSTKIAYVQADLLCGKHALKELPASEKVPEWKKLYEADGCVEIHGDISDRTVIVIDDLYQSGATIWSYAGRLKQLGAKNAIGLVCIKSMRDTDNQ